MSSSRLGRAIPGNIVLGADEPEYPFTADAVLLKTNSTTFTADALLSDSTFTGILGVTNSQPGNIVLGVDEGGEEDSGPPTFFFTANAVIHGTINDSFLADAALLSAISGSFTADAVIASGTATVSGSFTADSVLLRTIAATLTANAVLLKVNDKTFTANAEITFATFTANAIIQKTVTIARNANAVIKKPDNLRTFTADAYFDSAPVAPVLIFEDTFTRSTSAGDMGTPSGGIHYYVIGSEPEAPDPLLYYVNGAELIVPEGPFDTGELWFSFGTAALEFDLTFDFITAPNLFLRIQGAEGYNPAEPTAFKWFRPRADIYDIAGDGSEFEITSGQNTIISKAVTPNVWHSARIQVIGRIVNIRVWERTDSEPSTWDTIGGTANNTRVSGERAQPSVLVSWNNIPVSERAIDNLRLYARGEQRQDFFTADAVLQLGAPTTVDETFTADAFISDPFDTHPSTFLADAILAKAIANTFTSNARIVNRINDNFTADSYIKGVLDKVFTANAIIRKPAPPPGETRFSKSITLQVVRRRERPLSAFVPPRNPDEAETEDEDIREDPDCLPPCPPGSGGPGGLYGANGTAIRKTIVYCSNCGGNWFWTDDNHLGKGPSSSNTHDCCTSSHSQSDHVSRMFIEYAQVPEGLFQMRAKLAWVGTADSVQIQVYGNAAMPDLNEGDCMDYDPDWWLSHWQSGTHLGNLVFTADETVTLFGTDFKFSLQPSSLTIDGSTLGNNVFRFRTLDEANYLGAQFKPTNQDVTLGDE